jgi:hypothetical protein
MEGYRDPTDSELDRYQAEVYRVANKVREVLAEEENLLGTVALAAVLGYVLDTVSTQNETSIITMVETLKALIRIGGVMWSNAHPDTAPAPAVNE